METLQTLQSFTKGNNLLQSLNSIPQNNLSDYLSNDPYNKTNTSHNTNHTQVGKVIPNRAQLSDRRVPTKGRTSQNESHLCQKKKESPERETSTFHSRNSSKKHS